MARMTAKVTSKGQITLPARLRVELGVRAGDHLIFERNQEGKMELLPVRKTLADLKGILPYDGPPLSDEDIIALVREARDERAREIAGRSATPRE